MIPKPQNCNQDWLSMQKAEGGRICGKCQNLMTDFTKMSWSEIERKHTETPGQACGMYSQKQLDHWGREVPSVFSSCSKSAVILSSIFTALNFQSAEAKPLDISGEEIYFSPTEWGRDTIPSTSQEVKTDSISGIVFDDGKGLPLAGAIVFFVNSDLKIITNETGRFKFEIPDSSIVRGDRILRVDKPDYFSDLKNLDQHNYGKHVNLFLQPKTIDPSDPTYFRIAPPTAKQRAKHWWQRIFKKKN